MNGTDNVLLDTNVILGFLNGNAKINSFFEKQLMKSHLHVSQVTRMELLGYPNISPDEEKFLKSLLSQVKILPIDDTVCDQAIDLRKEKKLKLPDALIAATAISFNLVLITCDADFSKNCSRFRVVNPMNA